MQVSGYFKIGSKVQDFRENFDEGEFSLPVPLDFLCANRTTAHDLELCLDHPERFDVYPGNHTWGLKPQSRNSEIGRKIALSYCVEPKV